MSVFTRFVNGLGHDIWRRCSRKASNTFDAIHYLRRSTTMTGLKSCLVLYLFAILVSNFARFAAPPIKNLKKGQPARLGQVIQSKECKYKRLAKALMSLAVLAFLCRAGRHTLNTDACNAQIDYVLLRDQNEWTTRAVGYWSSSLDNRYCAYNTIHRDCYTVAWTILLLRFWPKELKVFIRAYRDSQNWILNLSDAAGLLELSEHSLSKLDADIIYIAGTKLSSCRRVI